MFCVYIAEVECHVTNESDGFSLLTGILALPLKFDDVWK